MVFTSMANGRFSLFFGTLREALVHFEAIGHAVPEGTNPADHFLAATDTTFAAEEAGLSGGFNSTAPLDEEEALITEPTDFHSAYASSALASQVRCKDCDSSSCCEFFSAVSCL